MVDSQVDSTKNSRPQYGFSRNARFSYRSDQANVDYPPEAKSAVGRQVSSSMRSAAQYGFGSARRFADRPSSAMPGATPGPGSYNA